VSNPVGSRNVADSVRAIIPGVGQTLITLGMVLVLFAVYEVCIYNYFAHREQEKVRCDLATG
jgi:sortase A